MSGILIMNSKINQNIKMLQSIAANPKYQDGMDEVIALYKTRKIENIRTATKIAEKFAVIGKGSAGAAKSGLKLLTPYRTKAPATGKLERHFIKKNTRAYFVKGTLTVRSQYVTTNGKTKERKLNPKVFIDQRPVGFEVMATSKEDAEKQWKIKVEATTAADDSDIMGEESESFVKSTVEKSDVNSVTAVSNGKSEAHTPMKKSCAVKYGFIPEDATHQKNEGFCVIDNFVGIYNPLIKRMTREYFIEKVNKKIGPNHNGLDEGIDFQYDITDGVTPSCLMEICKEHDISMYAYDITNNCFLKHVTKTRNYPALVYYAIGGHMYWISDQNKAQSLIKKAYDKEAKIKSIVLQEDWQKEGDNKFLDKIYYNNVPIAELDKYANGVVVLDKKDLCEEMRQYIKTYNAVPSELKNNKVSITQFYDAINDVIITTDPNDTRCINYEVVKQICEEQHIEFTNQSLTTLIRQMRTKIMTTPRATFDKEFRKKIYEDQGKCCQMCHDALKMSCVERFHIDHIQALANGGSNHIDNLQILCQECHFTKTKEEAEDGWVKVSETESSFNSETSKVHESDLSRVWAFVEKREETHDANLTLFGFDINKCRKNQMYYNKYNYPKFTVMDKVEEYKGNYSRPGMLNV